jgi:hypothetical protein
MGLARTLPEQILVNLNTIFFCRNLSFILVEEPAKNEIAKKLKKTYLLLIIDILTIRESILTNSF